MMTRHLLIVGASLTDDNVLRLTHEVAEFRGDHGSEQQPFGSVLDVEASGARQQLWNGELNWLAKPGADLPERARTPDIFLDALAAQADTAPPGYWTRAILADLPVRLDEVRCPETLTTGQTDALPRHPTVRPGQQARRALRMPPDTA